MPREKTKGGGGRRSSQQQAEKEQDRRSAEHEEEEEEEDDEEDDEELNVEDDEQADEATRLRDKIRKEDEEAEAEKPKVCEGQTLEERRRLRQKLNEHKHRIANDKQAMGQIANAQFEKNMLESNKLFNQVRYTREAQVDGTILEQLAQVPLQQVEQMATATKRYDATEFLRALQGKFRDADGINWEMLGARVSPCFRCVPEISFMLGPLDKPPPERKDRQQKRKRATEENATEVQPEQVTQEQQDNNDVSVDMMTAKRVKELKDLIEGTVGRSVGKAGGRARDRQGLKEEVDVFSFLFNPHSFTQTVENVFDLAFQCKEGAASLVVNKEHVPVIRAGEGVMEAEQQQSKKRQAVLSLTMSDWKDLCEAYGVDKCMVRDRDQYQPDPNLQRMLQDHNSGSSSGTGGSSSSSSGGGGGGRGGRAAR